VVLARLLAGIVLVYESNGIEQVLWNCRHAASNFDLAREVTMCEKLQLRNVVVLGHLVRLGVWKEQYRPVLCIGG
jgi:hypothetical protein